jgi:tRNA uridine 5-carboxymethylaminomethyl modification enzyme
MERDFDIVVIGGGHAGAEAAAAGARMGARTALLTLSAGMIAQMSCNPAIGGIGKGQMVREIDSLGGLMGRAADATAIQFRMLNRSKGPAVWGPRCQSDRHAYAAWIQQTLAGQPNLTIIEGEATDLVTRDGAIEAVRVRAKQQDATQSDREKLRKERKEDTAQSNRERREGRDKEVDSIPLESLCSLCGPDTIEIRCRAVVVTAGTFLNGLMHLGEKTWAGGRYDEPVAAGLGESLRRCGLELGRLKTGTCPRLAAESVDYSRCQRQDGDQPPYPFSFLTETLDVEQIPCWITATNEEVHQVIRDNLHRAPMFTGQITSTGPRYCPSLETKVVRFADKAGHQIFLEPEGRSTNWVYCNGISTSLPPDVQGQIVHGIAGLERAEILRYGYAIEYDYAPPTQLRATLETKVVRGLFLAGQVNGTTGYEEAAAQGLLAGANAAATTLGRKELVLRRDHAYIGVMIDDLVTKGVTEPYRMFTSRSECRLSLRYDNADRRLTPLGREIGLVGDERWRRCAAKEQARDRAATLLGEIRMEGKTLAELLRRPETAIGDLLARCQGGGDLADLFARQRPAVETAAIDARYAGYLAKEQSALRRMREMEDKLIPPELDYARVSHLRQEAREKFQAICPRSLGQALRISGITPADVTVLAIHLAVRRPKAAGK